MDLVLKAKPKSGQDKRQKGGRIADTRFRDGDWFTRNYEGQEKGNGLDPEGGGT